MRVYYYCVETKCPRGQEDELRVPVDLEGPKAKRGETVERVEHVYTRPLL